jgi:hypothetical protein
MAELRAGHFFMVVSWTRKNEEPIPCLEIMCRAWTSDVNSSFYYSSNTVM